MFTDPKTQEIKGMILTNGEHFLDQFQAMHSIATTADKLFAEEVSPETIIELREKLQKLGLAKGGPPTK
jgi:hypothetical protein